LSEEDKEKLEKCRKYVEQKKMQLFGRLSPSYIRHRFSESGLEHDMLEAAHSTSKEGMIVDTHEEANDFNEAYDELVELLVSDETDENVKGLFEKLKDALNNGSEEEIYDVLEEIDDSVDLELVTAASITTIISQ
jgi:hypothetical protein